VLGTLITAYVLFRGIRIIIILMLAIIIASALRPFVLSLTKRRIPDGLAILFVYAIMGFGIFTLTAVVIPPIANQAVGYIQNDNRLANRIIIAQNWIQNTISDATGSDVEMVDPEQIRTTVASVTESIRAGLPSLANSAGSTLGEVILVFVMGVYWLTSYQKAIDFITQIVSLKHRERSQKIITEIETSLGAYVRGIVTVATLVGILTFVILLLIKVPNGATIGFILGVSTMIPQIGSFLGVGLSTLVAMLSNPLNGVLVFAVVMVIQQIENYVITPRFMSRSIEVDPLLIMMAVFIGFALYGVLGGMISVPILGVISILLRNLVIEPLKVNVSGYTLEKGLILLNPDESTDITPVTSPQSPIIVTGS